MILERAVIHVLPGQESAFEQALEQAREVISQADGFRSLRALRGIESKHDYLLLIEWDELANHTVGFRQSHLFHQWRGVIDPFLDGTPTVEHFAPLEAFETIGS
ncbi:MAG: antibiotic biosynthesis monooxygenase [Solirubrobacteraceae bacterium]|jgi:heme-degrading monooxygenase HmoA